jgi:hypothetical protein
MWSRSGYKCPRDGATVWWRLVTAAGTGSSWVELRCANWCKPSVKKGCRWYEEHSLDMLSDEPPILA